MLKNLKPAFSSAGKKIGALAMVTMLAAVSVNSYEYDSSIQVNVTVDGVMTKTLNVQADTVKGILEAGGFEISEGDMVIPSADIKLMDNSTIEIKPVKNVEVVSKDATFMVRTNASSTEELALSIPYAIGENNDIVDVYTMASSELVDGGSYKVKEAFCVNIYADYATYPVMMAKGTVEDALELSGVEVDDNDIVKPALSEKIKAGMNVEVIRVEKTHSTENVAVPYDVEYRINKYLRAGEEVVVQEGVDGEKIVNSIITFHNGNEAYRDEDEKIVKPAQNKIVECGVWNVKGDQQNAASAVGTVNGYAYSKVISATATAYCDKGKTASGIQSKVGVVAVDPRVIPLGTRLYIESVDGSWSYGVCLAGDTGGLIKGNRVDLFYDEYNECMQFGRRSCNIYVLAD